LVLSFFLSFFFFSFVDAKNKLVNEYKSITENDILVVNGDVRDPQCAKSVLQQTVDVFGHLDILVNCAAGNFIALVEDISTNGFKTVVDIDLIGTFNMSKHALPYLKQSKKGSVINISATLHYTASPYLQHASAAKAGVDALTRGLATEWQEYNIRVNGVAPGPIEDTLGMAKLNPGDFKHDDISWLPRFNLFFFLFIITFKIRKERRNRLYLFVSFKLRR